MIDRLRARVGRRLEAGDGSPIARALASLWARVSERRVARPRALPEGARVIGVGGATLGGAGKTPLAVAIARALSEQGEAVALVGHAYRARPIEPRVVQPDDPVSLVGDDALACARLLASTSARVVVAPSADRAMDHAASLGCRALVVDGLLQAAPRRVDRAILALDGLSPWGSGACPPAGDLRAPPAALLAAADLVAALVPEGVALDPGLARLGALRVESRVDTAIDPSGARVPLASLTSSRVGLLVAIARPDRVARSLSAAGVVPEVTLALADHAAVAPRDLDRAARAGVAAWLTTARCATKLPPRIGDAPVLVLEHRLALGDLLPRLGEPGAGGRPSAERAAHGKKRQRPC
jgi:tetraacyldisaccharide 4'-kinase